MHRTPSGLGKAIVKRFYDAGAIVFALDVNEGALKELQVAFPNMIPVQVNLSDWEATKKAVEGILPLHHLVNNAAILKSDSLLDSSPENIDL
jgi:NAD(P)-dependent dehydrogenase (short-subunit alcohol dehydrogenase family)